MSQVSVQVREHEVFSQERNVKIEKKILKHMFLEGYPLRKMEHQGKVDIYIHSYIHTCMNI